MRYVPREWLLEHCRQVLTSVPGVDSVDVSETNPECMTAWVSKLRPMRVIEVQRTVDQLRKIYPALRLKVTVRQRKVSV